VAAAEDLLKVLNCEDPHVAAECIRIARRLRAAEHKVIGLVPSDPEVAVPPVAIRLGMAFVDLSGATVAYVDANVHLPAVADVTDDGEQESKESVFVTRWLSGSLALLSPKKPEAVGQVRPQLERALFDGSELFEHVLVDLTGFDLMGEEGAVEQMDALILVARAGKTTERDLLRRTAELPKRRFLGVLLVG
jgi:hypothetical protein